MSLSVAMPVQVPYTMGKQVSFDLIARGLYLLAASRALQQKDIKFAVLLTSAFTSAVVACLLSQPGDMILTETYKQQGEGGRGFRNVVGGIYRRRGIPGFFLGTSARLAHVVSIITTQLVIYDVVKVALGLPITGGH